MKRLTPQQELERHRNGITDSIRRWKHLSINGGSDPFWCDGCNMNLVRNHVIYHKQMMIEICDTENLDLPAEYYLPLPPVVPNGYMANAKQEERIRKLQAFGHTLVFKKPVYDELQLTFF